MAQTKQEIRRAWDKEHMKMFGVSVHKENEKDIIEYVERQKAMGLSTSAVFKQGIREMIKQGK